MMLFLFILIMVTDHFYDSPEYDSVPSQHNVPMDPEERERQEEEWRTELAKVA